MQQKYIQKLIDIRGRANLSRNSLFKHIFIDLEPFENSAAALRGLWQRSHYSWIMRPQCCLPTSFAVTPYLHNTLRWNNILTAHWSCEEKSPAIDGVKIWIGPLGLVSGCMRACFIHGCSVQNRKWDWISASDLNHWPWDCPVCDFQSKIPSSPVTGRERETVTSFEN